MSLVRHNGDEQDFSVNKSKLKSMGTVIVERGHTGNFQVGALVETL